MVFGMVVTKIFWAGSPIDDKLALADTVFDLVKAHVDVFGPFLFDRIICETGCSGVVCFHWCGWLRMA
jgi:hypothetical protein